MKHVLTEAYKALHRATEKRDRDSALRFVDLVQKQRLFLVEHLPDPGEYELALAAERMKLTDMQDLLEHKVKSLEQWERRLETVAASLESARSEPSGTEGEKAYLLVSKYGGKCFKCQERFEVDDLVLFFPGRSAMKCAHMDCYEPDDLLVAYEVWDKTADDGGVVPLAQTIERHFPGYTRQPAA